MAARSSIGVANRWAPSVAFGVGAGLLANAWMSPSVSLGALLAALGAWRMLEAAQRWHLEARAYVSMFERHPMPMWLQDAASGRLLAVNQAASELHGQSREAMLALRAVELRADAQVPALPAPLDADARGELVVHRHAGGDLLTLRLQTCEVPYQGRKATLVMASDLGAQLHAARALRHAMTDLEHAQRVARCGSWRSDARGEALHASSGLVAMTGLPAHGASLDALAQRADPDDRPHVLAAHAGVLADGAPRQLEWRLRDGAGRMRVVQESLRAEFDELGWLTAIVGMLSDVTEHRAAQAQERALAAQFAEFVDCLPEAVLVLQHGCVVYANDAAERLMAGGRSPAGVVGRSLGELEEADGRPSAPAQAPVVGEATDFSYRPRRMRRLDGSAFEAEVAATVVHFGGDAAVLKLVRDMTMVNRARREVECARSELAALSARLIDLQEGERRAVARELHDEIGQALTALRVHFARLERHVADSPAQSVLADAASVTEGVLDRARSLSLMLHPPQLETLGLEAALAWQLERLAGLHPAVKFEADIARIPRPVSPKMAIAAYRVTQEALTNALRHGAPARLRVTLQADADGLSLQVQDDGIGFRVQALADRCQHRPSLGLLGMTERAKLLGGRLQVQSEEGRGTTIGLTLPWRYDQAWQDNDNA